MIFTEERRQELQLAARSLEEASKRNWVKSGDITFKADGNFDAKDIKAMKWYIMRWADGGERAGPSMMPHNKRWRATNVVGVGRDKFRVAFETDEEDDEKALDAIENEIIGKDGFGGMLWDFAVHDVSSPKKLQMKLYGGYYQNDDHMRPIRYHTAGID